MEKDLKPVRLQSLDALRGFDMMWIISVESIVHALSKATGNPVFGVMSNQLNHSVWNGFTFYDMIFPLFIFIAGISMPYSFSARLGNRTGEELRLARRSVHISLIKRTILLILLGMVVNQALEFNGYDQTRFASVLGRIAIACFFAALIFLHFKVRYQIAFFVGILLTYWMMMKLIPVPGIGAGVLTPEGNLEGYIDRLFLPGKLYGQVFDPEGLLSNLPAIATALLGVFTGSFLRLQSSKLTDIYKGIIIGSTGIALLLIALLWDFSFPINKSMWTSSFVLYAGGWSLILFAVFYLIIDVWGLKKWSMPFVWIGTNSILIYMASHGVVNFAYTSDFLFGGMLRNLTPIWQEVWVSTGIFIIQLALLRFFYKKRWFLKL